MGRDGLYHDANLAGRGESAQLQAENSLGNIPLYTATIARPFIWAPIEEVDPDTVGLGPAQ